MIIYYQSNRKVPRRRNRVKEEAPPKRVDVILRNEEAKMFTLFKKKLEEATGFPTLPNTAVITWLLKNNTLSE